VDEIQPYLEELATVLYENCPSGVGARGDIRLQHSEFDRVLQNGAAWGLERGYSRREDVEFTEEGGRIDSADPAFVSTRAMQRGHDQIGTLGAGNHFIEVDSVAEVFHPAGSDVLGLFPGQVVVQIHCGSRGLGHQVCQDYVSKYQTYVRQHGIALADRELVFARFDSPEGQEYFRAMACAANFAFANRQVLTHKIRRSFEQALAGRVKDFDLSQVYDVAHNMAKVEEHTVANHKLRLCVHRKGATRAFGPGAPGLPPALLDIGQPVLIPGSMGTASFVLLGTTRSMEQTFGSTCHGAGRLLSRMRARKTVRGDQLRTRLQAAGILVRSGSMTGLAEEAPEAYKDVERVVDVVAQAGIARKLAQLRPIAVIKS
jgi:tRNA-splicing ligase RtcB